MSVLVSTALYASPVRLSMYVHDNDHLPYEGLSPLDVHDEGFTLLICAFFNELCLRRERKATFGVVCIPQGELEAV